MLETFFKQNLIDIEGFLLYHYKNLNIEETETMIILMVLRLEKSNQNYITPRLISNYMTLDEKTIDRYVVTLINKQLLSLENNSISSKPLIEAVLKVNNNNDTVSKEKKEINLVEVFEKEFGRSLTPIEIEILKEWKRCQYSDEMILEAIKEATLSNVHNMRYIEKILVDWAKHGMKITGRQKVNSTSKAVDLVEYDWWNE